jgi:glycosyltransferase involved in cell wall biosynthesis
MTSVEVILPCLDEAEALPQVLARMPAGFRPLVVDNGSIDGSPELAERLGARVVRASVRGYGAACHAGLLAAIADFVVVMDCDGSLDPAELPAVLAPLRSDVADFVVGRRRPVGAGSFPRWLRLANAALAWQLRRRTGLRIADCGPVRAASREFLLGLELEDRRSGYPAETVVKAADAGARIVQVPVSYRPRLGQSKVTGTPSGVWRAIRDSSAAMRS